jgi:prepilin-type processing-associated H-X9-DG protein/prepilin-type N-terminal cleavage/methylation domain-containing protein
MVSILRSSPLNGGASSGGEQNPSINEGIRVMRSAEQSVGKRGLTLVEVLVTISALALLVALLMPALATARAQARTLVCRSNLRQLVLANTGYATENNGFYVPGAADMWDNAGLHRWHGARSSRDEAFDPRRGPLVAYLAEGRVKECPLSTNFTKSNDWDTSFEKGCGGYGYNLTYLGSRLWDAGLNGTDAFRQAYARTTSVGEVIDPGQTLMFADTAMARDGDSLIEYSFAEPPFAVVGGELMTEFLMSPSIHFRHGDRANVGWSDGHVGSQPMAEHNGRNVYGAASAALNLGWFEPVDNTLFDSK